MQQEAQQVELKVYKKIWLNVVLSRILTFAFFFKTFALLVGLELSMTFYKESRPDRSLVLFPPSILGGLVIASWSLLVCAPKACKQEYRSGMGCPKCNRIPELKSRHCRECGVCIRGHMFHARWAGTCIGALNWREYIGWMIAVLLYLICMIGLMVNQLILYLKALKNKEGLTDAQKFIQEVLHALALLCLAGDVTCTVLTSRTLVKFIAKKYNLKLSCRWPWGNKGRIASNGKGVFFRGKRDSPPVLEMEAVLAGIVPAPLCSSARDSIDLASPAAIKHHDICTSVRGNNEVTNESRVERTQQNWRRFSRSNSYGL